MNEKIERAQQVKRRRGTGMCAVGLIGWIDFYQHVAVDGSAVDGLPTYRLSDA